MLNSYPDETVTLYMVVQHAQQDWVVSVRGTCVTHSGRASWIPQTPQIASVFVSRCPCLPVCVCGVHVHNIRNHAGETGLKPSKGHQRNADGLEGESAAEHWLPCTPSLVANGWKQRFWEEPRRPYRKASSLAFAAPASFGRVWGPGKDLRSRPNQ